MRFQRDIFKAAKQIFSATVNLLVSVTVNLIFPTPTLNLFVRLLSPASSASMGVWMKNDAIHGDVRALKQQVKNVCAHAVSACMHRAKPYAVFFLLLFRECRSVSCEV